MEVAIHSFFHAWASHHKKSNRSDQIRDDEGREWSKPEDISRAFIQFYEKLFTYEVPSGVDRYLNNMEARVLQK